MAAGCNPYYLLEEISLTTCINILRVKMLFNVISVDSMDETKKSLWTNGVLALISAPIFYGMEL